MNKECTLTNEELIKKVDHWNGKLCASGGSAWTLSVPPDPNENPDLLIMELCKRFEALTSPENSEKENGWVIINIGHPNGGNKFIVTGSFSLRRAAAIKEFCRNSMFPWTYWK